MDSFRSTLCLQYPEQQLSLALVFMSLCISGLQPVPPTSGSQGYARSSSGAGNSAAGAGTGTKWLDLFEKDVDEHVLQSKFRFCLCLCLCCIMGWSSGCSSKYCAHRPQS